MSRLHDLIAQLCPYGVECKTIDEICSISRGRVMSKDYLRDNAGEYPVYSSQTANKGVFGYINSYDYDFESITWTTDGANAGSVFYHCDERFSITNVCGLLRVNTNEITTKFLYYALQIIAQSYVNSGMGNPKLMSNVMSKVSIPVPPLSIQVEIIRILDKFTPIAAELEVVLEAELEARKKQYEHYINRLLTFGDDIPVVLLGEVADIYDGTHQTPTYTESGVKFVSVENIKSLYESKKYISIEDYKKYKTKPQKGDVLMTRIGDIGTPVWAVK